MWVGCVVALVVGAGVRIDDIKNKKKDKDEKNKEKSNEKKWKYLIWKNFIFLSNMTYIILKEARFF